jgi:hypothetical protein
VKLLARHGEREYLSESIPSARRLVNAFNGKRFACLLWNHGVARHVEGATMLLQSLLDGGCRYVVCGGDDCEWWHDMIDELFVAKHLNATDAERDQNHVMTTWHANESPEDVATFFVFNTSFDGISFERFLVIHIGNGDAADVVDAEVQARAAALAG